MCAALSTPHSGFVLLCDSSSLLCVFSSFIAPIDYVSGIFYEIAFAARELVPVCFFLLCMFTALYGAERDSISTMRSSAEKI